MKKILLLCLFAIVSLYAKIDINNAPVSELTQLVGIGEAKAKAIVQYRKEHCFTKASDLTQVKGIGPKTVEKNKAQITVGKCSRKGKRSLGSPYRQTPHGTGPFKRSEHSHLALQNHDCSLFINLVKFL